MIFARLPSGCGDNDLVAVERERHLQPAGFRQQARVIWLNRMRIDRVRRRPVEDIDDVLRHAGIEPCGCDPEERRVTLAEWAEGVRSGEITEVFACGTAAVVTPIGRLLDGDDVVFVARSSPTRVFSAGLDIGYRLPAFCTSVGRAMLGRLDDAELAARLKAMRRDAVTPQTVTDPKKLLATIIADRAQGYSLVDREAEPHFRSISVPVRRYDGTIVAAINMGAHVDRVPAAQMIGSFLPQLREADRKSVV